MAVITIVKPKLYSTSKLHAELTAAGLGPDVIFSITWAGFQLRTRGETSPGVGEETYAPTGNPAIVGRVNNTEDVAQPGELRFTTTRELTPAELAQLDAVLTAHVPAVISPQ